MDVIDIKSFNNACDEFLLGKYILAEVKISSLLQTINENEKLKNIVLDSRENFDFNNMLKHCISNSNDKHIITLPNNDKEILAFVYDLLNFFEQKQFSLYDFAHKFFTNDDNPNQEIAEFANKIILPFKNAVNNIYCKTHVIVSTDEYQQNHYNKIMSVVREILTKVDNYKLKMTEKEEFTLLLNSLYQASSKNDKKFVYSLMVGLDYFSKYHKRTRSAYIMLEDCFTN